MKAQLLLAPAAIATQPLQLAEVERPEPAAGRIRVRVEACGVCHTDLHVVEGDLPLPTLPIIPGHQIVGRVDAVGEGCRRFAIGDRVGIPWLHETCGSCRHCAAGKENLCENIRFTGLHVHGGFAEYCLAPESFAYPVPAGFASVQAAPLLCAGIIGFRALRLAAVEPGQQVGLYGFGASAHICLQIARYWGCEVFVFTRGKHHRALARRLGAVWAGGAEDDPGVRPASSIIFAPAGPLVPAALKLLDKGGTLILAGIHMSPIPEMSYSLLYHERTVRSVANSTREDALELLALAARIPIATEVETFPLAAANEALQRLKNGRIEGAAVLQVAAEEKRLALEEIEVRCRAESRADEQPVSFCRQGREHRIKAILDRWYEGTSQPLDPQLDYFKVEDDEGEIFLIRYNRLFDKWVLVKVVKAPDRGRTSR